MGTYGRDFENAVVTHIIKDNLAEDGERYGDQKVEIKITKGTYKGQTMEATSPNGTLFGAECKKGMRVIVILSNTGDTHVATVYSQNRAMVIYGYGLLFFLMLVLISGVSKKSVAAIAGTLFGVLIASVSAVVFGAAAGIDGYHVSDIESLLFISQYAPVRVGELLFSGIVISALGAVMDVSVDIASFLLCQPDWKNNG